MAPRISRKQPIKPIENLIETQLWHLVATCCHLLPFGSNALGASFVALSESAVISVAHNEPILCANSAPRLETKLEGGCAQVGRN